jgi:molecular chaperone HtpG
MMNANTHGKIAFQVETERVLEILSKEIYDSPLALLRENVQNAYDAVLMRGVQEHKPIGDFQIEILVEPLRLTISDNGIGMTEEVLRNNFWKAGSSGKKSELARQAGVIGTFGIGAMANFGVCSRLRVETRSAGSDTTLISAADKSKLSISEDCIDLERINDIRQPGTRLIADLEKSYPLTDQAVENYLSPYVKHLPVSVILNGKLISQQSYTDIVTKRINQTLGSVDVSTSLYSGHLTISVDSNGQVLAHAKNITMQGNKIAGELLLVQGGGQLFGLRNYFGLAPIPVGGAYQLGGIVNLILLHPTAGREALSRESIDHVNHLVSMFEYAISEQLAKSDIADKNLSFLQFVVSNKRFNLADRVTVEILPESKSVPLGQIHAFCKGKTVHYYTGHDQTIIQTFAHDGAFLLRVSPNNPRRNVQLQYIKNILGIKEVPDKATVTKDFKGADLSIAEASLLARIIYVLNEDYLLANVEIVFSEISHGVAVLVTKTPKTVLVNLARNSLAVKPVLSTYQNAYEVFEGFVKDFVRIHLYPRLSEYIPSSTREGVDALAKLLQRNRELFRVEENDLGNLEPFLGDYLSGQKTLEEVINTARSTVRPQTQRVSHEQVGSFEDALPDVAESPVAAEARPGQEYEPAPAIMREEIACDLKILVTNKHRPQLNNFELFLALSDRLFKREREFFRQPHTTKLIWAGHRVIYIFTEASGRITVYYDIELREPLDQQAVSGGMFPTTTIFTKDRIYIPVPEQLVPVFRITAGAKEFYVRFDTIMNG